MVFFLRFRASLFIFMFLIQIGEKTGSVGRQNTKLALDHVLHIQIHIHICTTTADVPTLFTLVRALSV